MSSSGIVSPDTVRHLFLHFDGTGMPQRCPRVISVAWCPKPGAPNSVYFGASIYRPSGTADDAAAPGDTVTFTLGQFDALKKLQSTLTKDKDKAVQLPKFVVQELVRQILEGGSSGGGASSFSKTSSFPKGQDVDDLPFSPTTDGGEGYSCGSTCDTAGSAGAHISLSKDQLLNLRETALKRCANTPCTLTLAKDGLVKMSKNHVPRCVFEQVFMQGLPVRGRIHFVLPLFDIHAALACLNSKKRYDAFAHGPHRGGPVPKKRARKEAALQARRDIAEFLSTHPVIVDFERTKKSSVSVCAGAGAGAGAGGAGFAAAAPAAAPAPVAAKGAVTTGFHGKPSPRHIIFSK
jgi:hypothetical protein